MMLCFVLCDWMQFKVVIYVNSLLLYNINQQNAPILN